MLVVLLQSRVRRSAERLMYASKVARLLSALVAWPMAAKGYPISCKASSECTAAAFKNGPTLNLIYES